MENIHKNFLVDLTKNIIETCDYFKSEMIKKDDDFSKGAALACYLILSVISEEAKSFEIDCIVNLMNGYDINGLLNPEIKKV